MTNDQQELTSQMCKLIELTVNRGNMRKQEREWYLNTSWKLVMDYVRKCKNETNNS